MVHTVWGQFRGMHVMAQGFLGTVGVCMGFQHHNWNINSGTDILSSNQRRKSRKGDRELWSLTNAPLKATPGLHGSMLPQSRCGGAGHSFRQPARIHQH